MGGGWFKAQENKRGTRFSL